jgi:hypothetical protein
LSTTLLLEFVCIAGELVVKLDNNSHIIRSKSETYLQRAFDLIVESDVDAKVATRNQRLISFYQEMSGIDMTTWEVGKMIQNAKTSYDFAWPKFSARGISD